MAKLVKLTKDEKSIELSNPVQIAAYKNSGWKQEQPEQKEEQKPKDGGETK